METRRLDVLATRIRVDLWTEDTVGILQHEAQRRDAAFRGLLDLGEAPAVGVKMREFQVSDGCRSRSGGAPAVSISTRGTRSNWSPARRAMNEGTWRARSEAPGRIGQAIPGPVSRRRTRTVRRPPSRFRRPGFEVLVSGRSSPSNLTG